VPIGEQSFAPDAAIGIALYPGHGEDPQALVRNAKLAARAARTGSERVALYDPGQGAEEERRVRDEARLRDALEQNALALAFEPQLDPRSAAPRGLACTLCWRDAELGEVPEARAIEAAESAGMIRELTSWLFNNALREGAELARRGLALPIAVRVTAGGLLQPDFPEFVDRALRTWRAAPERLTIGVQEAALAAGTEPVRAILERLHALGVRLGLCDFGAGAMPLSALAQLPLDEIELGPNIVADMQRVELHARIARSLVQLARSLGLRVAAAGVPDAATAAALAALGCERIRGAAAGRALSAQEALERFGPQP
jgi:EAL domain-containing protein (putative c-di-GMP-specific phosphodiesterase class I)